MTNASPNLEPFHNEYPTNDLSKCIDEIVRELKRFDLPKTPVVHTGKDSPIIDSPPKSHLIHTDGDTSHIKNFSPIHLPPSSPHTYLCPYLRGTFPTRVILPSATINRPGRELQGLPRVHPLQRHRNWVGRREA